MGTPLTNLPAHVRDLIAGRPSGPQLPVAKRAPWGSIKRAKSLAGGSKSKRSSLEQQFVNRWTGPAFVEQYRFHETRMWRFDFAFVDQKTAVEMDGGLFVHGGHNRGIQIEKDHEKRNAATLAGWAVFTLGTRQITAENLAAIAAFIANRNA